MDFILIDCNNLVIDMVRNLGKFKKTMDPAKELYTRELLDFNKDFDALGGMTLIEEPDIDT